MKKLLLLLYVLPFFSYAQSTCREVVGYYAGWQWYDRNRLMNPQSVPYQKYSILTYALCSRNPTARLPFLIRGATKINCWVRSTAR